MGRHFTEAELDLMQQLKADNMAPTEIHKRLQRDRRRRRQIGPDLTTVRRALAGATFKRTQGPHRGMSPRAARGAQVSAEAYFLHSLKFAPSRTPIFCTV